MSCAFQWILNWNLTMTSSVCHRFWQCSRNSRRGSERSRSSSRRGIKRRCSRTVTAALRSHTSFCTLHPIPGWQAGGSQTAPQFDDINLTTLATHFCQIIQNSTSGKSHSFQVNVIWLVVIQLTEEVTSCADLWEDVLLLAAFNILPPCTPTKGYVLWKEFCSHRRISCVI